MNQCVSHLSQNALAVLDAVIRYSSLPSAALYHFVLAVCNTVNVEKFCEPSWKVSGMFCMLYFSVNKYSEFSVVN